MSSADRPCRLQLQPIKRTRPRSADRSKAKGTRQPRDRSAGKTGEMSGDGVPERAVRVLADGVMLHR
jgi:hypothetical protein